MKSETDVQKIFEALGTWIKQRPGLDKADYGIAPGQQPDRKRWYEGYRAYQAEVRSITADGTRARKALAEARRMKPEPGLLIDSFRAFSGRLSWDGEKLKYTTGQYWPTEYRKAAASVLELYCAACRQKDAAENPRTFTYRNLSDVIAANEAIGNHWFDRSTMRFFNTKIESNLIAGHRFITSEKGPDGVRKYTVREACPDGTIDTVGEFQAHSTLRQAKAAVLATPEKQSA